MAEVLVVGAGPVGLTMAIELARHGVRCRIVDQLTHPSPYCRAIGVTPRTLEIWDDIGIARDMIDAGIWITGMRSMIHGQPPSDHLLDLSDLPYGELGVPQYDTERLLAGHLARCGIEVERGLSLTALSQSGDEVVVRLDRAGGGEKHAAFRWVVGCDGAHSAVRHALGLAFEGDAYPMMFMLGDVHIDWDLPRGMALRALRLVRGGPPDMFVAIPLPEPGRYRVSMLALPGIAAIGGTDHGIQGEERGPDLAAIQAIADDLVLPRPRLSDLRWSSLFRISMRLAENYRQGRVFIAGDAAHIHPPTGGQGMNTGIQDAYNLAWKLALVLRGVAAESLLDSYDAERRPIGAEVVARTRAASEAFGREGRGNSNRLADSQIGISYRGTPWVKDGGPGFAGSLPAPGDRAPDATGLRRNNVGFPIRLFDVLRGTEHVLVAHLPDVAIGDGLAELARFAGAARERFGGHLRVAAITASGGAVEAFGVPVYHDAEHGFSAAYGSDPAIFLVRPDGYIGWRGGSCRDAGLPAYFSRVFAMM